MKTSPKSDRQHAPEHQVDDGLRDREVQRAEMDRHPLVLLELLRRVELAARERVRGQQQRERREGEQRAPHRAAPRLRAGVVGDELQPERGASTPAAYVNAAASPSHLSDTATAKTTTITAIARKSIESRHACGGEVTCPRSAAASAPPERLGADPEHRADRPACDAPAGEQEDRQRDTTTIAAGERRAAAPAERRGLCPGGHQTLRYLIDSGGDADRDPDDGAEGEPEPTSRLPSRRARPRRRTPR